MSKRRREESPDDRDYPSRKRRYRDERDRDPKYRDYDRDYEREKYRDKDDRYYDSKYYSSSSRSERDDRKYYSSRDYEYDRYKDRESSRSSHRDHRYKERERDSDRHRRDEREYSREKDRERSKSIEKKSKNNEEEIELRKKQKEEEEARLKIEEEEKEKIRQKEREEEQKKLEIEMEERKKRIAVWREQVLKKKLQEKEEVEKELQEKEAESTEKWSFDEDNADGYSSVSATNQDDNNSKEEQSNEDKKVVEEEKVNEEPEIDPLEAFMQELRKTPIEAPKTKLEQPKNNSKRKQKQNQNNNSYSDEEMDETNSDDEEWKQKIRKRELQRVDHSTINYLPFKKDFYIEVPEISKLTKEEIKEYRESLGNIRIRGKKCPSPIFGFHQCGLSDRILEILKKHAYTKPTPIQAQAIPAIMSGRDIIGIAKTGSGKTLAFLLPMLRHILDQSLPTHGEGPIGIIMAPTRELAVQIHTELRRFTKRLGIKSVCIFGGSGISHQIGDLKRGAAIAVCTPGRMIDILCTNAGRVTNLKRVTYLVLDEADRMFDMGFEPQIMRIIDNIRPDRQTVMFSATFPRQVEAAARKILKRPIIEIIVGGVSVVCSDVKQIVEVRSYETRFARLLQILGEWQDKGSILIFVNQQDECDNIFKRLTQVGHKCSTLHGGKDQMDRASTINDFKNQEVSILVATSVAARGLDVPSLNLVINYSVPNHYEDYVHRCGRTGRAGRKGTAVTFISDDEEQFAPDLEKALRESGVDIPDDLKRICENYRLKLTSGDALRHGTGFGGSGYKFDEAEAQAKKKQEKLQRKAYLGDEADDDDEDNEDQFDDDMDTSDSTSNTSKSQLDNLSSSTSKNAPSSSSSFRSSDNNPGNVDIMLQHIVGKATASGITNDLTAEVEINEYPQQARWKVTHKVRFYILNQ